MLFLHHRNIKECQLPLKQHSIVNNVFSVTLKDQRYAFTNMLFAKLAKILQNFLKPIWNVL